MIFFFNFPFVFRRLGSSHAKVKYFSFFSLWTRQKPHKERKDENFLVLKFDLSWKIISVNFLAALRIEAARHWQNLLFVFSANLRRKLLSRTLFKQNPFRSQEIFNSLSESKVWWFVRCCSFNLMFLQQ